MDRHDGDVPDFELIRYMANEAFDPPRAREAWGKLYLRHRASLSRICVSAFGAFEKQAVEDVVQEAFMKAFSGASKFNFDESLEPDIQSKRVHGWLARIMENLLRDRHRSQREEPLMEAEAVERLPDVIEPSDSSEPEEGERLTLLKSGMASLSEVEQTVLRATSFWLRPGEQHQRMPHNAIAQLSSSLGKSPENIRQIRMRALRKLEKHINDRLTQ